MRLVEGWHRAYKWSSMRFMALGGVAQATVIACPATIAQHVPEWIFQGLSIFSVVCIFCAMAGRITTTEPQNVQPPVPPQ